MASTPYSERITSSEFTQQTMLSDLTQQRWLIGLGVGLVVFMLFWMRRRPAQEQAARRLVRDFRHVDDPDDLRDVLGSNVPVIMRPALLTVLEEIERQVHRGFRNLERSIEKL
jgi:uncharacterized membrane protein YciS (DUF1049 family)